MGWSDVAVLIAGQAEGDWMTGRDVPRALGFEGTAVSSIEAGELSRALAAGSAVVVDLALSRHYGQGHIRGAWFVTRARLADAVAKLPAAETIVLTSPEGRLAQLAAAELAGIAAVPVVSLTGGTQAWVEAGLPLEQGATHMASEADNVVLSSRERNQDRGAAMREYLEWEINLVNDMATDDDHRFQVACGRGGIRRGCCRQSALKARAPICRISSSCADMPPLLPSAPRTVPSSARRRARREST